MAPVVKEFINKMAEREREREEEETRVYTNLHLTSK